MNFIKFQREHYLYLLLLASTIIAVTNYNIIICYSYRIYKFLNKQKLSLSVNPRYNEIQTQITRTLVIQAIIPLMICSGSYIFLLINILKSEDFVSPDVSSLSGLLFSCLPMGNALSILLFIQSYRRNGINLIKRVAYKIFCSKFSKVSNITMLN